MVATEIAPDDQGSGERSQCVGEDSGLNQLKGKCSTRQLAGGQRTCAFMDVHVSSCLGIRWLVVYCCRLDKTGHVWSEGQRMFGGEV